ncbi:MAG: hypothetical protein KJ670_23860 [Alphaproteobacteria bacterium]|nr:hypothetical protein [Rhizobiaceae bacterium]MBU3962562.1 hypothetical protein [Alphaproteobacteria bacterium]PJI38608.1 MAG: hypothetical protein CTR54_21285 [Rhizobium sp.]MBU4052352.1 hypothetical protein [Alphaproteobacteria bacterium]MBU4091765.1 hypothetical protein [Alphaproteobacteria bacterium]
MKTDTYLTFFVSMMVNAVVFGTGAITVLSIPALAENAKYLLPLVVVISFVVAPFIAKLIAPRMRLRNWRRRDPMQG